MKKLLGFFTLLLITQFSFGQDRQELTLDGAIEQALKNNLDIQISRTTYEQSQTDILSAYGIYDLQLDLTAQHSDRTRAPRTTLDASSEIEDYVYLSAKQLFSTGALVTLSTTNYKYKTSEDYQFSVLNPTYGSSFLLRVDQPLFNGWGKNNVEYTINLNRRMSEKSMEQLKNSINNLIALTNQAYLDLAYSFRNIEVAKESLELAKDQFEITRKKVDVGTLAPVDQLQAEANLADARQRLVTAENLLHAAQDQIKKILNLDRKAWTVEFVPATEISYEPATYDQQSCIDKALDQNASVRMAKLDLGISELTLDYRKNKKKPSVNLYGTLSYDGNNLRTLVDPATGQMVVYPGSLGDAFDMATSLDNESFTIGVNVSYPLQNRANRAAYMRAKLNVSSSELALENTIIQVTNDIRDAFRNMNSSMRSIEAAKKTQELREKNLEIEKKKFVNGMSTNFLVSQREEELAQARVSLLNAGVSYQKALILLKQAMGTLLQEHNIQLEEAETN